MKRFVVVEGMDGAGKGTAIAALREWAKGKMVCDAREYWKTHGKHPPIGEYDVLLTAEPTYIGEGKRLREELIQHGTTASPFEIAQAFSEDRKALYKKFVLPALKEGKYVFQERSVVSSLVYQVLMENGYTLHHLMQLPGNRFCLEHPPGLLIIMTCDPEVVMERLNKRATKQDNAIFEQLEFQRRVRLAYLSEWLKELFPEAKTVVVHVDTNPPMTVEGTKNEIKKIWNKHYQ